MAVRIEHKNNIAGYLDCSTNPNFPAAVLQQKFVVTVAGKIGGASGINVSPGDEIECIITTDTGGTYAEVGANFIYIQANVEQATETTLGLAKIATQTVTDTGTNDTDYITALKLLVNLATKGSLFRYKGATDCSTNPNYPAGKVGDAYRATNGGFIGGSSGKTITTNGLYYCIADNAGGNEATVGSSWAVLSSSSSSTSRGAFGSFNS
jgi:hypothetical protein